MNGPGKESMKRKYKIAMVQMDTQNNKEKNLKDACAWIDEAAASGAELVCFGMSICYDVRFPELYRLLAIKGQGCFSFL